METIFHVVALNELCDLENEVKVTCVPYLVRIHQILLEILSRSHLSYAVALNGLCDLENEVKVT